VGRLSVAPRRLLAAVIAVELLALYVVLNGGSWVLDDNLYLELARASGFGWKWLMNSNYGHWAPAHHAVYSLQLHLMPLDYRWALALMLVLIGGSIYLLERVIAMLTGGGWSPLITAACFGVSVLLIRPLQWWVSGLQSFPTIFCDLLVLYAYLRYDGGRSARWVLVSAGAMAVALMFYEKAAFMPLYIVLFRVLLMTEQLRVRIVWGILKRERWLWLTYGVVLMLWAVGYKSHGGGFAGVGGAPTASEWLEFFRVLWVQTLVPAVFGLTMPASNPFVAHPTLSGLQVAVVAVLQVVVVAAILVSVRRKMSAWRAWVFLAVCVLANGALTGAARIGQFGPNVAADLRYWLDFSWLVPLAVVFAFSPRRVFSHQVPTTPRSLPPLRRAIASALLVALLAYGAGSVATAAKLQRQWPGNLARTWETHLEKGLDVAGRARPAPILAENIVPWYILMADLPPLNQVSFIAPLYGPTFRVDGPVTGKLLTVDPVGNVRPAKIRVLYSDPLNRCLPTGAKAPPLLRRLPRSVSAAPGSYYVLANYRARHPTTLGLGVESGIGVATHADPSIALAPTAHQSIAWLGTGTPLWIKLTFPRRPGVCLWTLQVVALSS
jgi:hypothetical protein